MNNLIYALKLIPAALGISRNPITRRMARFELLSALAGLAGLRVYNPDLWWHRDQGFLDIWSEFPEATPRIHERRYNLYSLCKSVKDLSGHTVECGVFRGAGSHIILSILGHPESRHHIFDSFEGLSEPKDNDVPDLDSAKAWETGDLSVGEDVVLRNLSRFSENVRLYKGWIPQRFAEVSDQRFRLVHIDVDLYEPTRDALRFFYPRMVAGGMIVCDDYGSDRCPGAARAMDEFFEELPESVVHLTTGTGFVVCRGINSAI